MAPSESNERKWVFLLCLLAAIHVFIFSAAFPFFTNVDEEAHFDLAVKYSHGQPPRALAPLCGEAMNYYVVYLSQEYVWPPPAGKSFPPPVWTASGWQSSPILSARRKLWNDPNHESSQPPLYYTVAGLWWSIGKLCGFHGGFLLYWLRFLNLFVIAALVWLGYVAARLVFPDDKFIRLGVPALLAFMPQTAFYSLQNDMLSAVCFGLVFILLVKLDRAEIPAIGLGAALGLVLAATFLTKSSNLPLLAVATVFICLKIFQLARAGKLRAASPSLLALCLCAAPPVAAWLVWCKHNFGDFSGTAAKIHYLGWTHKPVAEWWTHPIFTPHGLWTFYSGLLSTFWQGEFLWHRQPLPLPGAGAIYALISAALVIAALISLRPRSTAVTPTQRHALWFGFWGLIAAMVFLGFLSIIYDFHDCFYPSREHPYFTSGRLMLGLLIPLVMLFVYGLDQLLGCLKSRRLGPLVLGGMVVFMLISEIATDWPVFASEYNWFHMQNTEAGMEPPGTPSAGP